MAFDDHKLRVHGPDVVSLEDRSNVRGGRSITNDAESVIAELAGRGLLEGRRIIYRDSSGIWDELEHKDGRFAGYRALGEKYIESAIERVRSAS